MGSCHERSLHRAVAWSLSFTPLECDQASLRPLKPLLLWEADLIHLDSPHTILLTRPDLEATKRAISPFTDRATQVMARADSNDRSDGFVNLSGR